ncbi:MAG TPA: FtsX-like permease family protein [Dictyobacter sp.]|jgi:putative ABC transport system permease protein|nr:FtsX-like permease family protein [Dictyobacter sp.]
MIEFFGIPIDTFTTVLLIIAGSILLAVVVLALSNLLFFKIGVRNITRRRTQMVLIIFALMLSTTLLSSVLATGDVMTSAVQSVAVYNWGNIDEDIEGGNGALGLYSEHVYQHVLSYSQHSPTSNIAAVSAAIREQNLLVADVTSRQVRSGVTGLGVIPGSELGFGGLHDVTTNQLRRISSLPLNSVYLNQTTAQLLNAHAGDTLYLYSERWPGRRYEMHVVAVVDNSAIVGDSPFLLSNAQTFQGIEHQPDQISQIFIANRGDGGVSGVGLSTQVSDELRRVIPPFVHVIQVKQQGVQDSLQAQQVFSRIFSLFALFALAISLLLIFLIFVLLAAERRAEMGMVRAIGLQRRHLILMYLFEGCVYDLMASFVGMLSGVGIGVLIVWLLNPILQRFNFPLQFTIQPHSLIVAYCLGVIFTFCAVALSAWFVSRMTIVEAIRDLPEPTRFLPSFSELRKRFQAVRGLLRSQQNSVPSAKQHVSRLLWEFCVETALSFFRALTLIGLLPLVSGYALIHYALAAQEIVPFSLGLSLFLLGVGLFLKQCVVWVIGFNVRRRYQGQDYEVSMRRSVQRLNSLFAALIGLSLVAYWALPFDVLLKLGLPRFHGGIEVFFVAAVMMVVGSVWALLMNIRLLIAPLLFLCERFPMFYTMTRLAVVYPVQRRFRTGLSIVMFSLVVFAMTVMAVITNAMQSSYVNINEQTGGYDIQATAYFKSLPSLPSSLAQHGINPQDFSAIGMSETTEVGVIQTSAQHPRWGIYPAQIVSGGFLQGYGVHLTARAKGFTSDEQVWQALQTHSNYALIDSSALQASPYDVMASDSTGTTNTSPLLSGTNSPLFSGIDDKALFSVDGVTRGSTSFPAIPIWAVGQNKMIAKQFTIIGVVDNSDSDHYGLYLPDTSYSQSFLAGNTATSSPQVQSYYFKVAPGQDARALSLALGSAYLNYGTETTVLADAIWQTRGPRILLSDVLLGVVGLTLLLGVAALALTGTRAVIERRQQIGMLRAMGSSRHIVQGAFLLESFLVGMIGSILGCVLGLILARNIFSANFFVQYQTGLFFSIPWDEIVIIVGVSFVASLLGAILPAWQAGSVAPAEALRYS